MYTGVLSAESKRVEKFRRDSSGAGWLILVSKSKQERLIKSVDSSVKLARETSSNYITKGLI